MRLSSNDFNVVPPVSAHVPEDFPSDTIMLYGVLHHLANAEAERQLRNQINYNAQGLSAGIDDKFEQYHRLSLDYKQLFEQKISEYKKYQNLEEAWGGSFSPYAGINQWKFRS